MPFATEPPTPPDHAFPDRPAAWDYLRHLISIIQSLFGTPGELTLLGGISDSFRADMASWLRPCERLARLLLFAEAAEHNSSRARSAFRNAAAARRSAARPAEAPNPRPGASPSSCCRRRAVAAPARAATSRPRSISARWPRAWKR